ncbi:MAG TPA: dihydrofolate reductase family protein [Iamia sp.]|nr:dihydrofolate reductase family protein [Iamia sp.]
MSKLRVHCFTLSLDGCAAGPDQSLDAPFGTGADGLPDWQFGATGLDERFVAAGNENVGATIMGRNMFGPVRGPWGGSDWTGWWGEDPPYHHDVFVLTHHAHDPIPMAGGTTFHFVTDGIEAALDRARTAAGGRDVRVGGGASVVRQYLAAGLVDELHLAIRPVLVGTGERLFADGVVPAGYAVTELVAGEADVVHARVIRTP